MRILVTGANGFIGNGLVPRLAAEHEVFVLGRSRPASAPDSVRAVPCDLSAPEALPGLLAAGALPAAIDVVLHLAVSRLHRDFPGTALDMFNVNVAAAAYLLDYAQRAGASQFVVGSTGSVYDPFRDPPLDESRPLAPTKYFPASKAAAEMLARPYAALMAVCALRFFVPYGPRQEDRMIANLIAAVTAGKPVILPPAGDGIVFNPVFHSDAIAVVEQAVRARWSGTVNVAGPETLTLADAARAIGAAVGRAPLFERSATAGAQTLVPDLTELGRRCRLDQFVRFGDGIRRCLDDDAG